MLTKYTASEIMSRIVHLDILLHALRGNLDLLPAKKEAIIKDAQEALQTYHNFLLIREGIPDHTMSAASIIGEALLDRYIDTDLIGGSENADHH